MPTKQEVMYVICRVRKDKHNKEGFHQSEYVRERERHRLGHSHEIPSMHKITIFRVSHKVWSYDKFSVDRQLHKTTYQLLTIYESF